MCSQAAGRPCVSTHPTPLHMYRPTSSPHSPQDSVEQRSGAWKGRLAINLVMGVLTHNPSVLRSTGMDSCWSNHSPNSQFLGSKLRHEKEKRTKTLRVLRCLTPSSSHKACQRWLPPPAPLQQQSRPEGSLFLQVSWIWVWIGAGRDRPGEEGVERCGLQVAGVGAAGRSGQGSEQTKPALLPRG